LRDAKREGLGKSMGNAAQNEQPGHGAEAGPAAIRVENLSKQYVDFTALHGISFAVGKGEILGFLGPNGAGKTTTLRILTGFLPASGGRAVIDGHDVAEESREVRRRIGYLPENVPLYPEMRVSEYLAYRAALKDVPRRTRAAAIDEAVGRCGLGDVRYRIIGQLSKGYRQRVGLADVLVHRPPILILDEPTVGLDPTQIREVRDLIKDLGRERTVMLSTHILPEVEMICRRVIILARGRVVAQDTPARLREQLEGRARLVCEVRGPATAVEGALRSVAGVSRVARRPVEPQGDVGHYELEVATGSDPREEVARALLAQGFGLRELRRDTMSLEDIFVEIVTREQHDGGAADAAAGGEAAAKEAVLR
jgi:ABC-2 type transport system ATP-binding protein